MYSEHLAILLLVAANGLSHPGYVHQTSPRPAKTAEPPLAVTPAPGGLRMTTCRSLQTGRQTSAKPGSAATLLARNETPVVNP